MRYALFILVVINVILSCRQHRSHDFETELSFYHWKTNFSPTAYELDILRQHKVQQVYLRFFDVAWDATYQKPSPIAQLRIADKGLFKREGLKIIPTVFITNECIRYLPAEQCGSLAEKISKLVNDIIQLNDIEQVDEIQIDCDWTATSREKYFALLSRLQEIDTQHLFSATIRLFQVKYMIEAGIPPVKKGLLMCYNMGNLKSISTGNSIFDPGEVKKYIGNLDKYPLKLDLALPVFSWYVLFRQGGYAGLVQNIDHNGLGKVLKPAGNDHFEIVSDTILYGNHFKKGDVLRYENCSYDNLVKAASLLKQKLPNRQPRLVLYHLDSIILSKYSAHEIEAIFNSFH